MSSSYYWGKICTCKSEIEASKKRITGYEIDIYDLGRLKTHTQNQYAAFKNEISFYKTKNISMAEPRPKVKFSREFCPKLEEDLDGEMHSEVVNKYDETLETIGNELANRHRLLEEEQANLTRLYSDLSHYESRRRRCLNKESKSSK